MGSVPREVLKAHFQYLACLKSRSQTEPDYVSSLVIYITFRRVA